jgi:uncharacterized protein (DUF58 family)
MFNETWGSLAILLVLLGLLLRQDALFALAAFLLTMSPLAWLWNRWAPRGLRYRRSFAQTHVFAGETVALDIELINDKWLPLPWVRVDDRFPETIAPLERPLVPSSVQGIGLLVHVASLGGRERVRWRYHLACPRRGFYFFGPTRLRTGDIFGLFRQDLRQEQTDRLVVYPQIRPLPELGLPDKEPFGEQTVQSFLFADPLRTIGARDYHPDDPLKHIHWKATASQQRMQVRVFERTRSRQVVIFLNVSTFAKHWHGVDPDLLEKVIRVAASLSYHAHNRGQPTGLIANGSLPRSDQPIRVLPGRAPDQMRLLLEALAAVTGFPTAKLPELLALESPRLPWGATLVVVTAVVDEALLATLTSLKRSGRRVVLVSLDEKFAGSAGDRGLLIYHLDPGVV